MAIFGGTMTMAPRAPGATASANDDYSIRMWLFGLAAMVFAMVVVGGATRLTGSGLSITEWQPILGTLPPLSDAAWADAFDKYQHIPQYTALNRGMSLSAFKVIYSWEWGHRLLGRLLGVAFLVPLVAFMRRGSVGRAMALRLGGLFVLLGLQGALGWYMVQSGLADRIDVSQYRLAAHLLLASTLLAALIWTALDVGVDPAARIRLRTHAASSRAFAAAIVALVFLQIGAGALVAGLHAGLAYNTWPLMDGHLAPSGLGALSPWWLNLFENGATVQFDHRLIAYALAAIICWHAIRIIRTADDERMRISAQMLLLALAAQITLGIATLVSHVPLDLALAHQATAVVVLATAVWHLHSVVRG